MNREQRDIPLPLPMLTEDAKTKSAQIGYVALQVVAETSKTVQTILDGRLLNLQFSTGEGENGKPGWYISILEFWPSCMTS